MINKSFKLTETLVALDNYESIGQMKNAYQRLMARARQQTNAHLQLPLQTAIITSESVVPHAVTLVKAQMTRSTTYKYYEVWTRGDCREPEERLFIVCSQTGGPVNVEQIAAAYRSARAAAHDAGDSDEPAHAAGVAAARAAATRPAARAWIEDSDHAEDYGLAAEVPGRWYLVSILGCSCQLFTHHG